jgi:hypothetical protein
MVNSLSYLDDRRLPVVVVCSSFGSSFQTSNSCFTAIHTLNRKSLVDFVSNQNKFLATNICVSVGQSPTCLTKFLQVFLPKQDSGRYNRWLVHETSEGLLTDKRRIPLRSASVRTPHLFHHGIPKVLVNPRSKGITSVPFTITL